MVDAHEIMPGIFLGNIKIAQNLHLLKYLGVTSIVNCAIEIPNYFPNEIRYHYIPLNDHPSQDINKHFEPSFSFIDQALSKNEKVLVHCAAGISRSTTILTAYLARKNQSHPTDILNHIKQIRSIVHPNHGFMDQLKRIDFQKSPTSSLFDIQGGMFLRKV